jgi:hypothetical protein
MKQYLVAADGRLLIVAADEVQRPTYVIANLQHKK